MVEFKERPYMITGVVDIRNVTMLVYRCGAQYFLRPKKYFIPLPNDYKDKITKFDKESKANVQNL